MKTSEKGKIALAVSEGIVDTAYLDSVGVWTLGIGHTAGAGAPNPKNYIGKKISINEVMDIFSVDLNKFEKRVNDLVKVPLEQHEFDALVHFDFNTGGLHRSNLLKLINAGKKKEAGLSGFHGWLKPIELKGRRDKERNMFLNGAYGRTVAPLYTANEKGKLRNNGTIDLANVFKSTQKPVEKKETVPVVSEPEKKETSVQPSNKILEAILNIIKAIFGGKNV